MRTPASIAAVVGLLLLGAAGLFPPLKRPANFAGTTGVLGSRSFLLSGEYTFYARLPETWNAQLGAEIDFGRLFAEVLVIVSATGAGVVVLQKPAEKRAEPDAPTDRPRE